MLQSGKRGCREGLHGGALSWFACVVLFHRPQPDPSTWLVLTPEGMALHCVQPRSCL